MTELLSSTDWHGAAARRAFRADLERCGPRPWLRELSIYAILVYRFGTYADRVRGVRGALLRQLYWAAHRASMVLTHIEIPKEAQIGDGLRIHHTGPVVFHPDVVIGRECTVRHGVTLGERATGQGVPRLGDHVELGAYSQVLGPVRLGDGCKIGAMALVLSDVPAGGSALAPTAVVRGPR